MKKYTKNSLVTLVTVSTALATIAPSVSSVVASANTHHVKSHKVVKAKKTTKKSHKFKLPKPYNYKKKHKKLVAKVTGGEVSKVGSKLNKAEKSLTKHFKAPKVKIKHANKQKAKVLHSFSKVNNAEHAVAHKISSWFHHKK